LEPKTKLPKFNPDDENDDLEFFDSDLEMKSTSLETPTQGAPTNLDSMPNV
jgi:hypothetical protein